VHARTDGSSKVRKGLKQRKSQQQDPDGDADGDDEEEECSDAG
jgi:hypothetical protein